MAPDPTPIERLHPNARRVARHLSGAGIKGGVVVLPDPAPSAARAAAQLGCEVAAIANSLVFDADGAPLLVLISGAHRANTVRLAELVGASHVGRASPEFVRSHTGQPIGGVSPVGHPKPLPTLVDVTLRAHQQVWAAAGHPHTVFATSFAELLRLTGGTPAEVA